MNISLAGEFCCYMYIVPTHRCWVHNRNNKKRLSGVDDCIREEFIHMYVCAWMFICTSQKEGYNKFVYLFVVVVCVVTVFSQHLTRILIAHEQNIFLFRLDIYILWNFCFAFFFLLICSYCSFIVIFCWCCCFLYIIFHLMFRFFIILLLLLVF